MPAKLIYKIKYLGKVYQLPESTTKRNIHEYVNSNYTLKCPKCNNIRLFNYAWTSKIKVDNTLTFDLDNTDSLLCLSCKNSETFKNTWKTHRDYFINCNSVNTKFRWDNDESFKLKVSEATSNRNKENWKDPDYRKYHTYLWDLVKELTRKDVDREKPTHIYYADSESQYKVGITNNLDGREGHHNEYYFSNLKSIRLFPNRKLAALCEYDAKMKYCTNNEFINKNAILDYIDYVNNWTYESTNYSDNILSLVDK